MKKENNALRQLIDPDNTLLLLRIFTGLMLFINHGYEKLFHFDKMLSRFPDPLGIGALPSLLFALISDSVLSFFIIIGLFTRASSIIIAINVTVAFFLVHKASIIEIHGELAIIYLFVIISIFLTGPGKKSLDYFIFKPKK